MGRQDTAGRRSVVDGEDVAGQVVLVSEVLEDRASGPVGEAIDRARFAAQPGQPERVRSYAYRVITPFP